jgi:hypothetical protein
VIGKPGQEDQPGSEDDLEGRFVKFVATIVDLSTVDLSAQYLNQAQRSCLQLLMVMGAEGSCESLQCLVKLGDVFFFIPKEGEDKLNLKKSESVGLEAVTAVAEALHAATPPAECKSLILSQVLSVYLREGKDGLLADRQDVKIDYKRLITVVVSGVDGCAAVEEGLEGTETEVSPSRRLMETTWVSLIDVLSIMIVPIPMGNCMEKISRVLEVMELVKAIVPKAPPKFASSLCETLVRSASNCLEVAELHERCGIHHSDKNVASKSKRHRDELIQLFAECFQAIACCSQTMKLSEYCPRKPSKAQFMSCSLPKMKENRTLLMQLFASAKLFEILMGSMRSCQLSFLHSAS